MDGLNAYTKPSGDDAIVDVAEMAGDLVMVMKMGGMARAEFIAYLSHIYDSVEVKVEFPVGGDPTWTA